MNFPTAALMSILAFGVAPFANIASAQQAQQPFQAPAVILKPDSDPEQVWIVAATKTAIRYREAEFADATMDARIADLKSLYLLEPRDYTIAMELFRARKYEEAKGRFSKVKNRYKSVASIDDSPGTLAAFYEMECLRRLGDLEGLAAALQQFDKTPLIRESQLRQLEIYVTWNPVHTKNWEAVDKLARDRAKTRLPGDQRAQVAYCHGLALEALERPEEAMVPYQTAITADAGASEVIARDAAIRLMTILTSHPDVPRAIKDWGSPQENKNAIGYSRLIEAASIAALFEKTLGAGTPLPEELKDLPKYRPKEQPNNVSKPEEATE